MGYKAILWRKLSGRFTSPREVGQLRPSEVAMMLRADETDEVLDDGRGRTGGEVPRPREHSPEEMARHAERRRLAAERRHGQHHPRGVSDGRS